MPNIANTCKHKKFDEEYKKFLFGDIFGVKYDFVKLKKSGCQTHPPARSHRISTKEKASKIPGKGAI
jgi:hypothetical protein